MSNPTDRTASAALPDEVVRPKPVEPIDPPKVEQASVPVAESAKEPRPIPTMGFPAYWYGFKHFFKEDCKVPNLTKAEEAKLAAEAEAEAERLAAEEAAEAARLAAEEEAARKVQATEASIAYLRELIDRIPHTSFAFIGVKGGAAATATMVNFSSFLADTTRTLVYGCDFNPASGSAAGRLGKDEGETISIQEFGRIVEEMKGNRRDVNAKLRPTPLGVRVLSADNYIEIPTEQYGTTTTVMLDVLDDNCDYLCLDTPNDITTAPARAILRKADVFVFTGNVGVPDSLRMLYTSMETARRLGFQDKVKNSVVVISGLREGESLDDYWKYIGQVNIHHNVTHPWQETGFSGQMLAVPFDPAIANDGIVNPAAYAWETGQAYRDTVIAGFEQAENMQQAADLLTLRGGRPSPQNVSTDVLPDNSH